MQSLPSSIMSLETEEPTAFPLLAPDNYTGCNDLLTGNTSGSFTANYSSCSNFSGGGSYPRIPYYGAEGPPIAVVELAKIVYGVIFLIGLTGNSLVLYVVLRFSKMQTVTNMYIFNLALTDQMFLLGLPFLITTMTYKHWPFGGAMCKAYLTSTSINQFTSSLLLTVMSADRYVAVCHPISSPRYRTPYIARCICLTAWTVSAMLMVPIYVYSNVLEGDRQLSPTAAVPSVTCNIYWPENGFMNGQKAFTLYSFTLGFAIPLALILLFYFLVICKLRTVGPKNRSKERKRSHRKVTYLVLTVITVYIICWLPYWITQVYITLLPPRQGQTHLGFTVILLAGSLSYANSAINPVLYAFLSENFRRSFTRAFVCASYKEVDNHLRVENSMFPHTRSCSCRVPGSHHHPEPPPRPSVAITLATCSSNVLATRSSNVLASDVEQNGSCINRQMESKATQV